MCLRNNLRDYWKKSHKENKCIIKYMIKWKMLLKDLRTLFKYQHIYSQWLINNEDYFNEIKMNNNK